MMKRLKGYVLGTFLIFAFFISIIPRVFASNLNNRHFIQIRFKASGYKNTIKSKANHKDSANVATVNTTTAPNNVASDEMLNPSKKNTGKLYVHNKSKKNSKRILIKSGKKTLNLNSDNGLTNPTLFKSGLLAKKNNYKKNSSHIFPMIINKEIVHYIHYYQTAGRKFFKYALSRSERYIPMIKEVFNKLGLPNDLAYLAMVESGFSPSAYSYAGASGMWQFIPSTGRLFGLTINWWVDERRNPVASTYAAGEYLKNLFDKFGSWYLAAAAYNSGELTIERALSLYPGGGFWTISQNRPYLLPGQTRRYVPKIIAAAIIAKDPENFGFHHIIYKKPIKFKQVNVPFSVSLYALAKCAGISENKLWHMNQDLLRNATPPNDAGFMLNIPADKYKIFIKNFKHIKKYINQESRVVNISYRRPKNNIYYTIEPGDTLIGIASKYGMPLGTLERYNNLNNYSILGIGERIIIPGTIPVKTARVNLKLAYVIVKPGMTLWGISHNYNIPLNTLRTINNITGNNIHAGEKIFIKRNGPTNSGYSYINHKQLQISRNFLDYRVKFGDSLYSIALRFHDNIKNIMAGNNIKNPNAIYPGEILKINQ